jgi:tRNA dimethylallyltransferase
MNQSRFDVKRSANKSLLIVISGPTGSGKTALSIRLAHTIGCSIISADSRQVFRELSIGSAAPAKTQLAEVPHYLVGSHSVTDEFNAGIFEKSALEILDRLFLENPIQIVCGGSGLYMDALINGFDKLPTANPEIRTELNETFTLYGIEALQKELAFKDPIYFNQVDVNNPQRIIRALEIIRSNPGKTYSELRSGEKVKRDFECIQFAIQLDREILYNQINTRVLEMIELGLIDEVKGLMGYRSLNALQTVGYTELFEFLDGTITLERAIEQIQQNTRRYAKRQLTWLNSKAGIDWIEPNSEPEVLLEMVRNRYL